MSTKVISRATIAAILFSLSACGTYTPPISYAFNNRADAGLFVNKVSDYLYCELRYAVQASIYYNPDYYQWLKYWSAEVTLTLYITEKTTVTPGATLTRLMPNATTFFGNNTNISTPQQFSFGIGGSYNNTAVRNVGITWFVLFKEFLPDGAKMPLPPKENPCGARPGTGLTSDLALYETLEMGLTPSTVGHGVSNPFKSGGPLQNIQYRISFDIDAGLSATPSWKLVNVTATNSPSLVGADRDRKDEFLITMGPAQLSTDAKGRQIIPSALTPSSSVGEVHNIGRLNSQLQR